jgi:rhodanese-related sulfurtransferase
MKPIYILVFVIGVVGMVACSSTPVKEQTGTYKDISVEELQPMLNEKDFAFVNVHVPFEGDLPQTDVSIPFNEMEQNLDLLPADKNAEIVLYCRSGNMSSQAAQTLANLGYTNVSNLSGGFNAWKAAGYPMAGED